jgi:cobalt/nickel transport system ATP-binding protein
MIRLRDIHFSYPNGQGVFDGLDFEYDEGTKVGLVGSNGVGKTTLFHIIMGLLRPGKGEVGIFGKLRKTEHDFEEVRQRIGLLFQDPDDQLFCPTVAEDVAFGPLNLGKSHHEAEHIAMGTLDLLGLSGYGNRITYQLSGGEKRLVSLATVMAMEPAALLLDEPTLGLDERTTERLIEIIRSHVDSCIIISHDAEFLKRAGTSTVILKGGRVAPRPS